MENNQFDRLIRDSLQGVKPTYSPESWKQLEDQIDAGQADWIEEEHSFDSTVSEKLSRLEHKSYRSDWMRMSKGLDDAFAWKSALYRYKMIEATLMLLAIFTVIHLLPYFRIDDGGQWSLPSASQLQINRAGSYGNSTREPFVSRHSTSVQTFSKSQDPTSASFTMTQKSTGKSIHIASNIKSDFSLLQENELTSTDVQNSPTGVNGTTYLDNVNISTTLANKPLLSVSKLELIGLPSLNSVKNEAPKAFSFASIEVPRLKSNKLILPYLSMMAGGDMDYIYSSSDAAIEREGYAVLSSGYSGGLNIGFEKGSWAFELGLIYDKKKYFPKPLLVVYGDFQTGYIGERLEDIEFNILKIPVNVQRDIYKTNRWRFYGLTGVTSNIALQANYNRNIKFLGYVAPSPNPLPSAPLKRKYTDGLLEGGSIDENFYFSVNAGIGVEYRMSQRLHLFLQPMYQHQLGKAGLGPNKDRFNSLSVYLGLKTDLK